jgi:hypothetical protein
MKRGAAIVLGAFVAGCSTSPSTGERSVAPALAPTSTAQASDDALCPDGRRPCEGYAHCTSEETHSRKAPLRLDPNGRELLERIARRFRHDYDTISIVEPRRISPFGGDDRQAIFLQVDEVLVGVEPTPTVEVHIGYPSRRDRRCPQIGERAILVHRATWARCAADCNTSEPELLPFLDEGDFAAMVELLRRPDLGEETR